MMLKRCICFVVAIAMIIMSLPIVTLAQSDESPRVDAVRGTVFVQRVGGHEQTVVYRGMRIYDGDIVISGRNSTATIMYYGQVVIMGELTTLAFNSVWQRNARTNSSISLIEGMLKKRVDVQLDENSSNMVQAAGTLVGVRGTKYILTYRRMLFGDDAVSAGNPFVRMLMIDGAVVLDLPDPDNMGAVASFLVTPQGMQRLTEDVHGRQVTQDVVSAPDDFIIPLESLDLTILEAIRDDPSAMALNPELFSRIEEAIENRRAEDERRVQNLEERPPPQIIAASEADTILPTLVREQEQQIITPPINQPQLPELPEQDTVLPQAPQEADPVIVMPDPEPIVEPDPAPIPDPVDEPTPELPPLPDPIVDPDPDPVVEPDPDPVVEPDPDPVVEPDPTPIPDPIGNDEAPVTDPSDSGGSGSSDASPDPGSPDPGCECTVAACDCDICNCDAATCICVGCHVPDPGCECDVYTCDCDDCDCTGSVCTCDDCCPVIPPLNITVTHSSTSPMTPIGNDNERTITIAISGFVDEASSEDFRLTVAPVVGLSFAGHDVEPVYDATYSTRTFSLTVTYNRTQSFENSVVPLEIALIGAGDYTFTMPSNITVSVVDGQESGRPIVITPENIYDLNEILLGNHDLLDGYFVLEEDISLTQDWSPIPSFSGTFDGNGNSIDLINFPIGASVQRPSLFEEIAPGGVVRNLVLTNINIGHVANGGTIVGGIAAVNRGTISNVAVIGGESGTISIDLSLQRDIGGLVGRNYGIIENSFSDIRIPGNPSNVNTNIGAIAGVNRSGGIIRNNVAIPTTIMGTNNNPNRGRIVGTNQSSASNMYNNFARANMNIGGRAPIDGSDRDGTGITPANILDVQSMLDATFGTDAPNIVQILGIVPLGISIFTIVTCECEVCECDDCGDCSDDDAAAKENDDCNVYVKDEEDDDTDDDEDDDTDNDYDEMDEDEEYEDDYQDQDNELDDEYYYDQDPAEDFDDDEYFEWIDDKDEYRFYATKEYSYGTSYKNENTRHGSLGQEQIAEQ